ncbi:hypothetical protein bAD24_III10310 [Burkholderia sp. AD24]|nr:hypothetical protein bAD24_III10310 [Burkholderia sp. AD24]
MKRFLDTHFPNPDDRFLLFKSAQPIPALRTNHGGLSDLCLVLSVVLCVLELAVQLLSGRDLFTGRHAHSCRHHLGSCSWNH